MKTFLLTALLFAFFTTTGRAQALPDTVIYFNLSSVKYSRYETKNRLVLIKTERRMNDYMFSLPCLNRQPGSDMLSFFGNDNPETGLNFDKVVPISDARFGMLKFMPFDVLIPFLKKYEFKRKVKLYFIENRNGGHYRYNVQLSGCLNAVRQQYAAN